MKHQFITGHYTDTGHIRIYTRDENSRRHTIDVAGFEPYFCVKASATVPDKRTIVDIRPSLPGVYGERLKKIIASAPNEVSGYIDRYGKKHSGLRDLFDKTWEADVKFVRRMLIDTEIKAGIDLHGSPRVVHYEDLVPCDFTHEPVVAFWDIEMFARTRIPDPEDAYQKITCMCFWDTVHKKYISVLLDDNAGKVNLGEMMDKIYSTYKTFCESRGKERSLPDDAEWMDDNWVLYKFTTEEQVIEFATKYFESLQPDVLVEWGKLDKEYFPPRARNLNIDTSIMRSFCTFNMLPPYLKAYQKGSGRLKDVALDEGIIDYVAPEVNFADLYKNDRMVLVMKNKLDVEWIVKLNEKKSDLVNFYWNLKNYIGVEDLQELVSHGVMIDALELRKYRGKYRLPTRPEKPRKGRSLIGALIKKPPSGLFDWVATLDFSRYYQNLLIGVLNAREEEWVEPLAELAQELQDYRDHYDRKLEHAEIDSDEYHAILGVRNAVKYAGESLIGSFGDKRARLYDADIYESVIIPGRDGIKYVSEICKEEGHEVLYYDTDGVDVDVSSFKDREKVLAGANKLLDTVNSKMEPWCDKVGLDHTLNLKIDNLFRRILYGGMKKRKAGWVVWEDGDWCDYLLIKGFEYIRRDSSLVTREVQKKVFDHLLREGMEGLKGYLNQTVKDIKAGKRSLREVAVSKGIKKDRFSYYKGTPPDFVRGAMWANKHLDAGIMPHDQVKMVYLKRTPGYPYSKVVSFLDEDIIPDNFIIDWDWVIDRTIKGKVNQYIKQGGLSWEMVMGAKNVGSVFG